jgi:hypothetical protein
VETRKIKPVRDLSVPRSEKLSLLLQEIGKEARVARVDFVSLQPEAIVDKGDFLELTIKMELKVRYRELYEFLDRLEATQQAVRVQELRYETTDALYPFGVAVLSAATYVRKQ